MALPVSGPLSLNDIAGEFGGATPHSLSEYYGVAAGIPTSGTISISDFYGASAISWDLSVISYSGNSFTATSSNHRWGLDFSPDSSKMFIGNGGFNIVTYTLSTPGDVTTATLTASGASIIGALPSPQPQEALGFGVNSSFRRFRFNPSGTKLYVTANRSLYEFNLSTPWDTSSGSISYYTWQYTGSLGNYPDDIGWNDVGSGFWSPVFPNSTTQWYKGSGSSYSMNSGIGWYFSSGLNIPRLFIFKTDGTKVFIVSRDTTAGYIYVLITEHDLSTPFDMATINSTPNATFNAGISPVFATDIFGFWINPGGKKLYILEYSNYTVFEFNL